jgi:hypothetical protein
MNAQHENRESFSRFRRGVSTTMLIAATSVVIVIAAVGAAVMLCGGTRAVAPLLHGRDAPPKAVVDRTPWDLGLIQSGEEFRHTFVIRNEGQSPLTLAPGPKLCACTVTKLPDKPVPPGGHAEVAVSFTASVQKEPMKEGHFSRGIRVLTNDPDNADMLLEVNFTVNRRLLAAPPELTLSLDSSKPLTLERRTFEVFVSSERWERFRLSVEGTSHRGVQCRVEPAGKERFGASATRGGYRVVVTLPPELPEGRIDEWVDLVGAPDNSAKKEKNAEPETLRIPIHGGVHGRMEFINAKIDGGVVLRLGTLAEGQAVHETILLKINDERRQLAVERIETEPKVLRAKVSPYHAGPNRAGLYRIELEIPADAPPCVYTSQYGLIRLRTDHPRLPVIELKVDFAIVAAETASE